MATGRRRISVRSLAFAAAGVALLTLASWTTITISVVPFTLQTLAVIIVLEVMSPSLAAFTVAVYLLMGAVGLPVFAGFQGGLATVVGPYGGYLLGFLVGVLAGGLVLRVRRTVVTEALAALACLVVTHAFGVVWLTFAAGMSVPSAIAVGSLQFLLPDLAKACLGVLIGHEILRAVPKISQAKLFE